VVSPERSCSWQLFSLHHRGGLRAEIRRALADVRPACEEYFARKQAAGEAFAAPRAEPPRVTDETTADAVVRAV